MKKSRWSLLAANLALVAVAVTVSCTCLCKQSSPASGTAPFRRPGQDPAGKGEVWRFAASGDSRNCGDVVMPGIAAGSKLDSAQFYWHLGDLRAIYDFDDDMLQDAKLADKHLNIIDYEKDAWNDFSKNQVAPFENIPFYLGIGNHETIPPKTRCEFAKTFSTLLDKPELQGGKAAPATQSSAKSKNSTPAPKTGDDCAVLETKTYYHWIKNNVDFIYLDNASDLEFDDQQMAWLDGVVKDDTNRKEIQTVVVGMHKALPWSVSCDHSMNEKPTGIATGVKVYGSLLNLQKSGKKVYVLASHSHYFMNDIFNTDHWNKSGGVLPGWIVGTAGAQRYQPPKAADLSKVRANVYGYLLGRVFSDGTISFEFTELKVSDIPQAVRNHYTEAFVADSCFAENRQKDPPKEKDYCKETP